MRNGNVFIWQAYLYEVLFYMSTGLHVLAAGQVQMKASFSLHFAVFGQAGDSTYQGLMWLKSSLLSLTRYLML